MRALTTLTLLFTTFFSFGQTFIESSGAMNVTHYHLDHHSMGGGGAYFDFNNDNFQDLYLTGGENRDHLYVNNQNGTFTEIGVNAGIGMTDSIKTNGVVTGDINNDGYRDIFVSTSEDHNNLLFLNNGDSTFTEISLSAGIADSAWTMTCTMGDYNLDGHLDIYTGDYVEYWDLPFYVYIFDALHNNLYLNNGDNTFTDVSVPTNAGLKCPTLATVFTDYDFDHDADLLIGNDFGGPFSNNQLLRNNYPIDDFMDISLSAGMDHEISAMGIAIGDYDEDQDLDYFITNMWENLLCSNNNDQTFDELAEQTNTEDSSQVSWGTFFFDYDNDTYLDLFTCSGGMVPPIDPEEMRLFVNQQNGTFDTLTYTEGLQDSLLARGAFFGDIDNDGDLDITVVSVDSINASPPNVSMYLNNSPGTNNYLQIKLTGTINNRDAFGSRIRIVAGGRSFIREISGGSSYLSQNSSVAHFGLGTINTVDSIIVTWPSGNTQIETNVSVNQIHEITEIDYTNVEEIQLSSISIYPNPTTDVFHVIGLKSDATYTISSANGATVQSGSISAYEKKSISLKGLNTGVYFIQITDSKSTYSNKIILQQ